MTLSPTPALTPAAPPLPPSPMRLSDAITTTLGAFKRKFGLWLGLGALPIAIYTAVMFVVGALLIVVFLASVAPFLDARRTMRPEMSAGAGAGTGMVVGVIIMGLLYAAAILTIALLMTKVQAMTVVAAADAVRGGHPRFSDLGGRTRGFMGRMLVVALLVTGALVVVYLLAAAMGITIGTAVGSQNSSAGGAGIALLAVALYAGVFYATVKLWYLVPVIAIEARPGIAALKRSWELSRGSFWRILGWIVVISLLVAAPMLVAYFIALLPLALTGGDPEAAAVAMAPLMMLAGFVVMAISLLAMPFQSIFQAVMYLDQLGRRGEPLPAVESPMTPFAVHYRSPHGGAGQPHASIPPYPAQGAPYGAPPAGPGHVPYAGAPAPAPYPAPPAPPAPYAPPPAGATQAPIPQYAPPPTTPTASAPTAQPPAPSYAPPPAPTAPPTGPSPSGNSAGAPMPTFEDPEQHNGFGQQSPPSAPGPQPGR